MIPKHVNLKDASEYLASEIKEISGRWCGFTINKRAILKKREKELPVAKEEYDKYKEVKKKIKGNKKLFSKMDIREQEGYKLIEDWEKQGEALEKIETGLPQFEEFLEVASELKEEVDNQIK